MKITKNEDGTTTIVATEREVALIQAAAWLTGQDDEGQSARELRAIADQIQRDSPPD